VRAVRRRVADRIDPVSGFGANQELRNMLTHTAPPSIWVIAGSFAEWRMG